MNDSEFDSLTQLILDLVPNDGSTIGNRKLWESVQAAAHERGIKVDEPSFETTRASLIQKGLLVKGKGRGGSVKRAQGEDQNFGLQVQDRPTDPEPAHSKSTPTRGKTQAGRGKGNSPTEIVSYRYADKRKNNPPVGLVNPKSDPDDGKDRWCYDPHIDPALQFDIGRAQVEKLIDDALESGDQATMREALEELKRYSEPYLNWTGKAERTTFDVDTVSLHVHERIDPASILSAVRKRMKDAKGKSAEQPMQYDWLTAPFENLPLRDAIDFYKHERGWANRLIAGDSLLVMNSLLQKESMAGQVQMIYIDPPYGIRYGSNFQPFVNKRDVRDRKDEDLTQEPEMIKAFRDTWELGIHSYLSYLRDRLLLAKELLHESGSIFVQISDENLHHVRELLDEVFGPTNLVSVITFKKTTGAGSPSLSTNVLSATNDYIIWYAQDIARIKFKHLYLSREGEGWVNYSYVRTSDGQYRRMTKRESSDWQSLPQGSVVYRRDNLTSTSSAGDASLPTQYQGQSYSPYPGGWKTSRDGLRRLSRAGRMEAYGSTLAYRRFATDFPWFRITNLWDDTVTGGFAEDRYYVVQTGIKVIERCLLMTTDPGDLVLDPTCGSGTTAFVAEKWGRRWITCDTSRVSVTLAKQRLMTASYAYYELKYPLEGLKGGFVYRTAPHITLKSIANNPDIDDIYESLHSPVEAALADLNGAAKQELREWEVPFDFRDDWPESARKPFDEFLAARLAMQKKMDESIAEHADQETLFDQPQVSKNKLRITGPFTVEAVPFPSVLSLDEAEQPQEADMAIARSGESSRQHSWRDELLKTGIRGKGGQILKFADLETLPDSPHLHISGHLDSGERVVVSFGPEHAALEQRQVALALSEAEKLRPAPSFIVFASFEFDPEAAKDIDETKWPGVTLLKAKMNADLQTDDLKKKIAGSQSFWLMGQPDVEVRKETDGKYRVEVHGFDYFDTAKGELVSGGKGKIAMWLLDTDYDERSLFPRQVFFPMAGKKDGWYKLKKNLRAELNESLLEKFHGTVSLPFEAGDNRKVAVKIIDDRGIESLRIIPLD